MQRLILLLAIFTVVLYWSHAYQFFFEKGIIGIKPLYWYLLTIGFSFSLIILNPASAKAPRYLIIWLWLFLIYSIFSYLYFSQSAVALQDLKINILTCILLFSFLNIFQQTGIRNVRIVILAVTIFAVTINFIDFVSPTWSFVPGRAAGLYVNPNTSGKILVFGMVASIIAVPQRFRLLYCMFVGAGIFVTLSRSTYLLWFLSLIGLGWYGFIAFKHKALSVVVIGFLSSVVLYSLLSGSMLNVIANSGAGNYLNPVAIERLGGESREYAHDSSVVSRAHVAQKAWSIFEEYPWLGRGFGYTREWGYISTHNMYLKMASEGGLLGVLLFLSLLIALWRDTDNTGKILIVLFALKSLFSHNMLEQPAMLILLALIALSYKKEIYNNAYNNKEVNSGVVS